MKGICTTNTLVVAVMNRNEFRKTFKEEHPDVKGVTVVSVHQFLHVLETLGNRIFSLVLHLELLKWHLQNNFSDRSGWQGWRREMEGHV